MKTLQTALATVVLTVLVSKGVWADDLGTVLAAAPAMSASVAAAEERVERNRSLLFAEEDPSLLSWSVGASATYRVYDDERREESESQTVVPTLLLEFAEPWGTIIETDIEFDIESSDMVGSLSISQPLRDLFWDEPDSAELTTLRANLDTSLLSLLQAEIDSKQTTLATLTQLLESEWTLAEAEYDLEAAIDALEEARSLGSYREGSAAIAALELESARARRSIEATRSVSTGRRELLLRRTGIDLEAAPRTDDSWVASRLTAARLATFMEDEGAVDAAPSVIEARWDREIAEAEYRDSYDDEPPEVTIGSTVSYVDPSGDDSVYSGDSIVTEYRADLDIEFDEFTIGFGGGSAPDAESVFLTAGVTWSPAGRNEERYGREASVRAIEAAALAEEESRLAVRESLLATLEELINLESEYDQITMRIEYAGLALEEELRALQLGFGDEDSLRDARWEVTSLEYELEIAFYNLRAAELDAAYTLGGKRWKER